jgi:hypothetical protein
VAHCNIWIYPRDWQHKSFVFKYTLACNWQDFIKILTDLAFVLQGWIDSKRLRNTGAHTRDLIQWLLKLYQSMENNKCIFFWGPASQTKLLLMLTFITLLIHSCDGQAIRTAMFEIPSEDQKQYMLKDCRNMIVDSIDCKCENLGKECQQTDVQNCTNCSCLKASSTKIFYIKKRYGAVCLSQNNLNNAGK